MGEQTACQTTTPSKLRQKKVIKKLSHNNGTPLTGRASGKEERKKIVHFQLTLLCPYSSLAGPVPGPFGQHLRAQLLGSSCRGPPGNTSYLSCRGPLVSALRGNTSGPTYRGPPGNTPQGGWGDHFFFLPPSCPRFPSPLLLKIQEVGIMNTSQHNEPGHKSNITRAKCNILVIEHGQSKVQ